MKNLFFDIQITGHHSEYICHLIDYLYKFNDNNIYYFAVHPHFASKFPEVFSKGNKIDNFHWVVITIEEYNKCMNSGILQKSFSFYNLMNKYAVQLKVNHVCLLYFNVFQLTTIFRRPQFTISGILFLQFYRMGKESFKEKLNYFRKYAVTKLYCLNPRIKTIFILNDIKTVDFLNNEFSTAVFKMLPDPIAELEPLENFDIYRQYSSCKSRKIFLHIGSLGDRKGTFEVIDSARYISEKIQNEIFILLVGMAEDKRTEQIILDKIKQNTAKTKVKIVWDNQFVPHDMMKSLFDQSYAVLLPYKNTEASSGILGHAAASNKKIIATGKGLIKELIEDNNLGILLDSVSPIEIAAKIDEIFDCQNTSNSKNSFVEEHSPIKFAALILDRNQLIL